MDVLERSKELESHANALRARRLAEKDLAWWAREIRSAASRGMSTCSSELRMFYFHLPRANEHYRRALSELLGDGFSVDKTTGMFYDGMCGRSFECTSVTWH